MAELLLEVLSEEIPAGMQARGGEELKRLVLKGLGDERLVHSRAQVFATPRRVTLVVEGIPELQPDFSEERKAPAREHRRPLSKGFSRPMD